MTPLKIRQLGYALGAEILDVDLGKPIDDNTFDEIHRAFLKYHVLVFRGHSFSREQHVAFSRRFGTLEKNETRAVDKKAPGFPEIFLVVSKPKPNGEPATGRYSGQEWHTDFSQRPIPAQASLLHGIEIPPVGGDTMFCNMYRAYDTLSEGMKKLLGGLHGVHMSARAVLDNSTPEKYAESRRLNPAAAHPIVRIHPETGRKSLYVSEEVSLLVGMTKEESTPLIHYLVSHAVRPQNVYRHQWQKDDLVIWDNRCLLHIALGDYDRSKVRHMERTTVNGTPFGYAYDGPLE